jgi:hypothetical protein
MESGTQLAMHRQRASERARARDPQKNQIYIVNLGNFILNALGFGWILCAARNIHSFIGKISKDHIVVITLPTPPTPPTPATPTSLFFAGYIYIYIYIQIAKKRN